MAAMKEKVARLQTQTLAMLALLCYPTSRTLVRFNTQLNCLVPIVHEKKAPPVSLLRPSNMCHLLANTSAMSLWVNHIDNILAASRLQGDTKNINHDITAEVLKMVTPRLPLSQRAFSRDFQTIESLMKRAFARYAFLKGQKDGGEDAPPPIQIVVLGGSVTMGVNCRAGIRFWDMQRCSWSSRLQSLVNTLVGGELVRVHNMAIGGTNTGQGRAIIEYELFPEEAKNPDILINGFATNDMHVLTMREAISGNKTLREKVFDMAQAFVRSAYNPCKDKRPLLLWLDDYLGNEQREVMKTTELSQGIQVLANYYGFGFVSYADVVRDWVYSDTREDTFSPGGWYNSRKSTMKREIHPGQTMHMATSWIFAFNLLHLATTHCTLESWNHVKFEKTLKYNETKVWGLPNLKGIKNGVHQLVSKPRPRYMGLPPALEESLSLDVITELWRQGQEVRAACQGLLASQKKKQASPRCPFSWVSGISMDQSKKTVDDVKKYFSDVIVEPTNWELIDDTGKGIKYGWMPNKDNGTDKVMTMEIDASENPVQTVALFFLKSYGKQWENSTAEVDFLTANSTDWTRIMSHMMLGFHDKKTSEMYNDEIHLPYPTRRLRLAIKLTKGLTFKVMGIAICRCLMCQG